MLVFVMVYLPYGKVYDKTVVAVVERLNTALRFTGSIFAEKYLYDRRSRPFVYMSSSVCKRDTGESVTVGLKFISLILVCPKPTQEVYMLSSSIIQSISTMFLQPV